MDYLGKKGETEKEPTSAESSLPPGKVRCVGRRQGEGAFRHLKRMSGGTEKRRLRCFGRGGAVYLATG